MQRTVAVLVAGAALRCLAPAQDAGSRAAYLERCATMQREVDEQRQLLNELFFASLAVGVESGAWTESDRNIARDAYEEMVRPIPPESSNPVDVDRRSRAKRTPERMGGPPAAPMRATTAVESWFLTRHYYLDRLFDRITEGQAAAAVEHAEELWLLAKKAADLAPAVRPLLDVRERGVRWPSAPQQRELPRRNPSSSTTTSEVRLRCMEAFDAWTIVASADGLLPPDPEAAPEAVFSEWQQNWQALRRIQHHFLTRPKIEARYAEVIERRAEAKRKTEQALIDLILKDAPLAELNSAATAISRYYKQSPQQQQRFSPPQPGLPIRDYRSLLNVGGGQPPPGIDPRQGRALSNYGPYLAWRKAVEERSDQRQRLQEELVKNLASLPPDVSAHVRQEIARSTGAKAREADRGAVPTESPKAANDLEALIAELQSARKEMGNSPHTNSLMELERLLQRGSGNELTSQRMEDSWRALAALPRGEKALALREKIGHARIKELKIAGVSEDADTPLIALYRQALEKTADAGQIAAAEAALAQSQFLSILPAEEAQEWTSLLAVLKTSVPNSSQRRASMRSIISNSSNPAVMRLAALKLKKM